MPSGPVTQIVRVVSDAYPPSVPPMSSTIGSPPAMTRSPGSWCGDALLGPEATIEKSARSWPSATSRSRTSRATSASVRPTSGPFAIASIARSAAAPAARSRATSSGSFRIRKARSTDDVTVNRAPGSTRWSPSTKAARSPSETATAATSSARPRVASSSRAATSAIGSSVSSQVAISTAPARAAGQLRAGVTSSRGAMRVAGADSPAGSTSSVSRSSGWAS